MRSFTEKELIKDDSHGPYVTFGRISASVEDFRTHIHRTADQRLMDLLEFSTFLEELGKAKVSKFVSLVLDEDVGGFEVPVDDRVLMQVAIATDELFDDDESFRLGHFLAFFEYVLEGAFVAELLEKIDVIRRLLDIVKFDDVRVFDGLHDLDLVFEGLVEFLGVLLDVGSGDSFDCHEIAGADVSPLEDLAVGAPADFLVNVDDEGFHELVVGSA